MAKYDYTLYDTASLGATVGTVHTLFAVQQDADANHSKAVTNMRGAGSLPSTENFVISWLGVTVDSIFSDDDAGKWAYKTILELVYEDKVLFMAPVQLLVVASAYGGHYTQASGADLALIGLMGNGYSFSNPIVIPGGKRFQVRITQGTAVTASTLVKVSLGGILDF